MPYDDDDLDTVLFGGDVSAGDGLFSPFDPADREDERENDQGYGDTDPTISYDRSVPLGGPFGHGDQGPAGVASDDSGPLPGTRGSDTDGADWQRVRAAVDAGHRNVRRVADERSGSPPTGGSRTVPPRLADSIVAAEQQLRSEWATTSAQPEPIPDEEPKPKRHYRRTVIYAPPQFEETVFEATMLKLQSNVNGEWIVTLRVPQEDRLAATVLGDAYGLALDVAIVRKHFGSGD